jgi:hypothetical protein
MDEGEDGMQINQPCDALVILQGLVDAQTGELHASEHLLLRVQDECLRHLKGMVDQDAEEEHQECDAEFHRNRVRGEATNQQHMYPTTMQ